MNIEKRARELFETGKYTVKEAFEKAELESKIDLPDGFLEIFNLGGK